MQRYDIIGETLQLFIFTRTGPWLDKTVRTMRITTMDTAAEVTARMKAMADERQRETLMRFFKTAPGEYGEGDEFLGIRVPQTRSVVAEAADMEMEETEKLIYSPWHEIRLCGLLILAEQMRRLTLRGMTDKPAGMKERERIVRFYLRHARQANNWDLVDLSAGKITGLWLVTPAVSTEEEKTAVMDRLADSTCMWEQRIAMVSTIEPTRRGDFRYVLRYAERLKKHPHDLMHKAVGWMLREMGKRDMNMLRAFLKQNYDGMSRTTLRYAIERMDERERKQWLAMCPQP